MEFQAVHLPPQGGDHQLLGTINAQVEQTINIALVVKRHEMGFMKNDLGLGVMAVQEWHSIIQCLSFLAFSHFFLWRT